MKSTYTPTGQLVSFARGVEKTENVGLTMSICRCNDNGR